MTLEDSARITILRNFGTMRFFSDHKIAASISPDSRHIALVVSGFGSTTEFIVKIYDGSTGERLGERTTGHSTPFFTPRGHDLWLVGDDGCGDVFGVGASRQVLRDTGRRIDIRDPPEGYPWASSRGCRVTDDWWILGPDGKRLLMLPPPWQCPVPVQRVWKGQFLALLHGELPEPVILELNQ